MYRWPKSELALASLPTSNLHLVLYRQHLYTFWSALHVLPELLCIDLSLGKFYIVMLLPNIFSMSVSKYGTLLNRRGPNLWLEASELYLD